MLEARPAHGRSPLPAPVHTRATTGNVSADRAGRRCRRGRHRARGLAPGSWLHGRRYLARLSPRPPGSGRVARGAPAGDVVARVGRRPGQKGGGSMTTEDHVYTDAELQYLSERRLGRIATVGKDGTPHVAPVGWSFHDGDGTRSVGWPRCSTNLPGFASTRGGSSRGVSRPDMHAIRLHAFGPAENLRYEDVPDPEPASEQVRIVVEASGVHLIDTRIRSGIAMGRLPLPDLPTIPGREVAGTVDATGPGVDADWVGRRVVAHLGAASRGYAELAVAPVDALHEIPDHLAADAAVAMIGTGRTAMLILDTASLTTDDVVLVMAAAGGLGSLFVQAARNAGSVVVGAAGGPGKVERVRALDADAAVDYLAPDWPEHVRDALGDRSVTVVLDGVGGAAG